MSAGLHEYPHLSLVRTSIVVRKNLAHVFF
jgi:hypothetical protein